jgi:hypothetical protein
MAKINVIDLRNKCIQYLTENKMQVRMDAFVSTKNLLRVVKAHKEMKVMLELTK